MTAKPRLLRLDHVQIAVPSGAEAECRAYWGGLLGLAEIPKPAGLAGRGGLWFRLGEAEIHLGVEVAFRPAKKAHPAFIAADIAALAQRLQKAGRAVLWDDAIAGRRRFFTEDPVGNRIEFIGAQ